MRFREYRIKAGYSQREVARILQVSNAAVAFWDDGKNLPSADKLPKLATLYKCKVDDLLKP